MPFVDVTQYDVTTSVDDAHLKEDVELSVTTCRAVGWCQQSRMEARTANRAGHPDPDQQLGPYARCYTHFESYSAGLEPRTPSKAGPAKERQVFGVEYLHDHHQRRR